MILFPRNAHKNDDDTINKFIIRFSKENVLDLENGWFDVDTVLNKEV